MSILDPDFFYFTALGRTPLAQVLKRIQSSLSFLCRCQWLFNKNYGTEHSEKKSILTGLGLIFLYEPRELMKTSTSHSVVIKMLQSFRVCSASLCYILNHSSIFKNLFYSCTSTQRCTGMFMPLFVIESQKNLNVHQQRIG